MNMTLLFVPMRETMPVYLTVLSKFRYEFETIRIILEQYTRRLPKPCSLKRIFSCYIPSEHFNTVKHILINVHCLDEARSTWFPVSNVLSFSHSVKRFELRKRRDNSATMPKKKNMCFDVERQRRSSA